MYEKITGQDVTVQIESASADNWIPEGIAVSQGIYDLPIVTNPAAMTPMGMNKSGSFALTNAYQDITGWSAMGSLSGTVITGNKALVVAETGSIMIQASVSFSGGFFGFNLWSSGMVRIILNNEIIATKQGRSNVTLRKVVNVAAGDQIYIQAKGVRQNSFTDYPTISASGTKVEFSGYDQSAIDFEEGMAYAGDVGFYDDTWGRYVSSTHLKRGLPMTTAGEIEVDATTTGDGAGNYYTDESAYIYLSRGSASGPILAQTRVPMSVYEGSKVNWEGIFRVRRTGSKDEQTDDGVLTGLNVRFSIWGVGIVTDEYGVDSVQSQEIMFYQATLQSANSESEIMIEYTLPTLPDATVPEGVDSIFFTCSLVQVESELYSAGTFTTKKKSQNQGPTPPPTSTAEMKYFGWKHTNPLKLKVAPPSTVRRVTTHPLSRTGVAYKNPSVFTNVKANAKITFFGFPGTGCTVDVYNYNTTTSTRGTLIGSYSVAANATSTVTISPGSGVTAIELVKNGANDVYVESVLNETSDTLTTLKTQIRESTFTTINDDIAKISIISEEGDTGTATIDFCSATLDPFTSTVLDAGKVIRILGRHYGAGNQVKPAGWTGEAEYGTIFTGVVMEITTEYDYNEEPIIQVICYNAGDALEKSKPGVAFDTYEKYIPFLNKLGISAKINGMDIGGGRGEMPDKFQFSPSSYGEYELAKSLHMTRNTNKGYVFVNRYNQLEYLSEPKTTTPFVFTDGTASGDISYGQISKKRKSKQIVNQVELNENTLDAEDFIDTSIGGEDGPPADIRYPSERKRTATFRNEESVQEFGEISKQFDVVRGDGDLRRLYRNDLGEGFKQWADVLLDQNASPSLEIEDISVPVKGSDDIRKLSGLDLLDPVQVIYKGTTYTTKIREIEHTIIPGKWFVEYKFSTNGDKTMW